LVIIFLESAAVEPVVLHPAWILCVVCLSCRYLAQLQAGVWEAALRRAHEAVGLLAQAAQLLADMLRQHKLGSQKVRSQDERVANARCRCQGLES
jgi:hypothetical protein